MALWMVRANPGQIDRMADFLNKGIIAVHWGIGDLTGCTLKSEVAAVVAKANLEERDANLKTGLLYRFAIQMKPGDYCIVPYRDVFYAARITSDYYFDPSSVKYEHQRKVEWLFDKEPFGRDELSEKLQASLKSRLALADLSQHELVFVNYLEKKSGIAVHEETEEDISHEILSSLLPEALEILESELNSDDPNRRLKAAIAVVGFNQKRL